jgi:hypothetical protein
LGGAGKHILGEREHDWPHAPAGRDLIRPRDELGDTIGAIDLRHPLRHRTEHASVIDFLERLALHEVGAHLADEQNHRRRILKRGVYADGCIGRTRSARYQTDARLACHLSIRLGHVGRAILVTARNQPDAVAHGIQRVQHR